MTHILIDLTQLDNVISGLTKEDDALSAMIMPRQNEEAIRFLKHIRSTERHIDLSEVGVKERAAGFAQKFFDEKEEDANFPSMRVAIESYIESVNDILVADEETKEVSSNEFQDLGPL